MAIREKFRYVNEDESDVQQRNATGQAKSHLHPPSSHLHPPSSVQPVEAEDPKESAGDHHLQKRVLNETIEGGAGEHHPANPAGQHATGSFTGTAPAHAPTTPKKNGQR